ncbi:hypothetical protein [Deinococcus sp.]|uniref:hypothetical protein n=1 Tax=Deinococcus sp. TaxID=47478 RepID=UPI003C7C4F1B
MGKGVALAFASLAVRVGGRVPAALATPIGADWQRQQAGWGTAHTLTLSVLDDKDRPGGRPVTAQTQNGPLAFRAEGEVFRTGGLTLETSAQGSQLGLSEEVAPGALLLAFTEVQRAAGLLPLHASVLSRGGLSRGGQTVAVSGPSGAGKSTAALRLLGRGWQLVAEDWAWLDPVSGQLLGWDSGLRLRPESLERFAPELLQGAPTDQHGKRVLDPPRLNGAQALDAIFFLSAHSSAPRPDGSRLELVRSVWGMVGTPLTPAARRCTQTGVNTLMGGVPMELIDRDELIERLG